VKLLFEIRESKKTSVQHPSLVKNDIRLGLVQILDANRPSGAHSVAIVSLVAEDFGKGVDQVLVVIVARKFSVDEYYRMVEAGILRPTERVELLDGQILCMEGVDKASN
jgi:hypothetical protein